MMKRISEENIKKLLEQPKRITIIPTNLLEHYDYGIKPDILVVEEFDLLYNNQKNHIHKLMMAFRNS